RSSIAGQRVEPSAPLRLPPSLSSARLMLLSRRALLWSWLPSRRRRSSPSFLRRRGTRFSTGLVASLARPGGNVTGLSNQVPDLVGKGLELLREVVPRLGRMGLLANVGNPVVILEIDQNSGLSAYHCP